MSTIINTPSSAPSESNNLLGTLIGLVVLAILAVLFFLYGLPLLRGVPVTTNPQSDNSTPPNTVNIQVPEKVDFNVNK